MTREASAIEVPFIAGDGVGPEIMDATRAVLSAAVLKATSGSRALRWTELEAGERSFRSVGEWMPRETIASIRRAGVAIKGPLATPVSGGIRSLNVTMRQVLDLYASVRPVRYFEGVPSPVKDPGRVDLIIFRENTEDVYKGLEWRQGSPEAIALRKFLTDAFDVELPEDTSIGLKPMSERASKRLVRAALRHAVDNGRRSVTLVHKGNIMKFTEGAFRDWGYEVAASEFPDRTVKESEMDGPVPPGKVLVNDRIADNMFQQVLTRPSEYSVLATPNLNGDYLADACAAQIGGLGFAPGANIGDHVAVFEPVHGTAPKYAGKDVANPCALLLSGAMMLRHLGLTEAADATTSAIERTLADGIMTQDAARVSSGLNATGTQRFAKEVILRLR
jgi:isocitrate dehydrogenase